ncbi:MAG TPA: hypothetical protein PKC43_00365 [Phycisphaerales bacterium]|nr:hypothetical protein [Phycisphaerales bacterium]HMP35878.1 hypothetical protein [Phycisphaerales bacterium]
MQRRDAADSGPAGATDWSMFGRLHGEGEGATAALDSLVRRYWTPVFAFVRRLGYDVEEASDLTQGFVADVILARRLLHRADPARGRFRSLLVVSLRNYVRAQERTRRRRAPLRQRGRSATDPQLDVDPPDASAATPEAAFEQAWSRTLMLAVLRRVEAECRRDGLTRHWALFEARIVNPIMRGTDPIDYGTLAESTGLPDAAHAANLVVTVKRRFARALREEIASTVFDATEIEAELVEIVAMMERRG